MIMLEGGLMIMRVCMMDITWQKNIDRRLHEQTAGSDTVLIN